MKLVSPTELAPTPAQHAALLATVARFNAACTWLAGVAYRERRVDKVERQKLARYESRVTFGLSAQMTIRALAS
jgi:hypothetical protein